MLADQKLSLLLQFYRHDGTLYKIIYAPERCYNEDLKYITYALMNSFLRIIMKRKRYSILLGHAHGNFVNSIHGTL